MYPIIETSTQLRGIFTVSIIKVYKLHRLIKQIFHKLLELLNNVIIRFALENARLFYSSVNAEQSCRSLIFYIKVFIYCLYIFTIDTNLCK
jgi:hypothetical protein